MDRQSFKDEIMFKLTGGVLDLEINEETLDKLIDYAFREMQRYIDTTKIVTIPFTKCIDLNGCGVNSVVRVYRTESYTGNDSIFSASGGMVDPLYASQWQLLSGTGNLYNFQDYVYNYAAWNTLLQIRNTTSTDLAFRYDKSANKLYINVATNLPTMITIEFIPQYKDVTEVVSDYWIDMIVRMSVALAKITLGRIRTRYTQTNALWAQDGEKLLEEGNAELADLREKLQANTQLCYPID